MPDTKATDDTKPADTKPADTTPADTKATDAASEAALARYRARMRPWRLFYAVGIVVAVVVALVLVKIAYVRGEISHVHLHTVGAGVPALGDTEPTTALHTAWSSADATAIGTPYFGGTVVSFDQHTVRGRDGRTGAQTWSYTRTDRTVCTAMQYNGLTVAVYRLNGNCDQVTALDTTTGDREWTRTLDKDTAEFNGPADFQVTPDFQPAPDPGLTPAAASPVFFFVSHTALYAIASNGVDYWTFHHVGCTINSAVIGAAGALISQTCTHEDCGGAAAKFCGDGPQLLLVPETSRDSTPPASNPDQITWNRFGITLVPVLAGSSVAALDRSANQLDLLDSGTGATSATLPLRPAGISAAPQTASLTDGDLLWLNGTAYALRAGARSFAWAVAALGPAVPYLSGGQQPSLNDARIMTPTANGVSRRDPATGQPAKTFQVPQPPLGSRVYPFDDGFLVAGTRTAVATA